MRSRRLGLAALVCLAAWISTAAAVPSGPAAKVASPAAAPTKSDWQEVDRLISEQKLEQAAAKLEALRADAERRGDDAAWMRALVRKTDVRLALGGFETAVKELREARWPQSALARAGLDLYLAHALRTYLQAYSWEIQRRERVEVAATGALDLKLWTREEIVAAAGDAFLAAWRQREALGGEPLASLDAVIVPNNYPREVRGTLRDALAYLFADFLADSSLWSPQQSSDLYLLDLGRLLAMDGASVAKVDLAAPAVEPVEKAVAVLADLEAWHAGRGERAAALEARLERSRRLHAVVTQAADRRRIREDLARRLPEWKDVSWWAEGMATLAGFWQDDDNPDALVRAREAALAGERAYPGTPGAKNCRAIAARIEAPAYRLTAMTADGADRRSIAIEHRNLARLYFRAYAVDAQARLERGENEPFPVAWKLRDVLAGAPAASWSADLPATPDFRDHRTYAVPKLATPGAYLIVASAAESFGEKHNQVMAVPFVLSELVLEASEDGAAATRLRALSGATGAALGGVEIRVYRRDYQHGARLETTLRTDADGSARFAGTIPEPGSYGLGFLALGRRGSDLAVAAIRPRYRVEPESGAAALFFTDRSIYRPGQTVHWKVLVYDGERAAGRLRPDARRELTVTLQDPNGQDVATATVATNDYGTAAGDFVVPPGRPLGGWSLEASVSGSALIQVEEYKRPTFEVKLLDPQAALRLNREAALRGEARYYFGLPVVHGTVRWKVSREPVYPAFWEWFGWRPERRGATIVAAGTAPLGEDGAFEVRFTPQADERLGKDVSYFYRLAADVTDEGGETRSGERGFRLGFVAVEAAIESERGFYEAPEPLELTVTRRSLDGAPRAGEGTWRLLELVQPQRALLPADEPAPGRGERDAAVAPFRTAGDGLQPRWASLPSTDAALRRFGDGAEIAHGALTHGESGKAPVKLPPLPPGAYRLRYTTRDEFGAEATAQGEFVVAGEATLRLPLFLEVEQTSAEPGEKVEALVHSGFPGQPLELEIGHRDGRIERRALVATPTPQRISIPVAEADRGGLALRLAAVRDFQSLRLERDVAVPWDNKELHVAFETFRDRLRPGTRETWKVKVTETGPRGPEAAAAELLAYMYDRSLDAFVPHEPPRPLDLFPRGAQLPTASTSLGSQGAMFVRGERFVDLPEGADLRGDDLRQIGGYGIGGPGRRRYEGVAMAKAVPAPVAQAAPGGVAGGVAGGVNSPVQPAMVPEETIAVTGEPAPPPPPPPALRSDFSETAFWQPHLLTGAEGSATIEFAVPDSVTSWNVWVHAITRDLRSGAEHREARSVKDLMVRPYLPRFLREGDRAALKVVLNDAGDRPFDGEVTLAILDPKDDASLLSEFGLTDSAATARFHVESGKSTSVTFPLVAPKRVGEVAFKVVAEAGDESDGELRPLPLLPSRIHLSQSRFVALRDKATRTMTFADLQRTDDPTRQNEQLVVTLDAQLFYSVLAAVPYLVEYPYECSEQTLNRFLSTAILSSLFERYPAVGRMAQELAKRETQYEAFGGPDPNRMMALEETPWLVESQGKERGEDHPLIRVLDPRIAKAQRDSALAKLEKDQLPSGAFPWWAGGPPSDYMTLYILYGFAKAGEFGVEVPREMVEKGWKYLGEKYEREIRHKIDKPDCDCAWEFLTFMNYVASAYPDPSWMGNALPLAERKRILDASFRHWKEHSPYLKGLLALTLKRMGRPQDAQLVFDSVMDSAKTTPDEGTFWQPEDRSWLWYNDTIETHAYALRALLELRPKDPRLDGLVQWLFLNKKLNHWKSTRATAEVVYSLAKYLDSQHELGAREAAKVEVGGQASEFTFEPDRYTGKKVQVVVPGEKVGAQDATITVSKETPGLLFASATWQFSTEELPKEARGDLFAVERRYFRRLEKGKEMVLQPLAEGDALSPGDEIEVQLSLRSRAPAEYVHLRDPRAAGFEPGVVTSGWKWDLGLVRYEEVRDSGTNFFFEHLPAGQYTLRYRVRANLAGTFRVGPATVQSMYAPEFTAYSAGNVVKVE